MLCVFIYVAVHRFDIVSFWHTKALKLKLHLMLEPFSGALVYFNFRFCCLYLNNSNMAGCFCEALFHRMVGTTTWLLIQIDKVTKHCTPDGISFCLSHPSTAIGFFSIQGGITEWFELKGTLKIISFWIPHHGQAAFHYSRLLRAPSNVAWTLPRIRQRQACLDNLCLTTLTARNFFLTSNLNVFSVVLTCSLSAHLIEQYVRFLFKTLPCPF